MLKITTFQETEKSVRVALCGQFTGEYVAELERTVAGQQGESKTVSLDLEGVTFVDREAMFFLCTAKSRNIAIQNIPSYVSRWILQERRCGSMAAHFKTQETKNEPK